jgi:integrase
MVLNALCREDHFQFQEMKKIFFPEADDPLRKRKNVRLSVADLQHANARMKDTLDKVRFALGFVVGLRAGEMLALKWTDLKPADKPAFCAIAKIQATMTYIRTEESNYTPHYQNDAKSDAGSRDYPVLAQLKPLLDAWKAEQIAVRKANGMDVESGDWFIASKLSGTQSDPSAIRKWFKRMIKSGILPEGFSPHNLRHSHGAYFGWANGGVTAIQSKLMGHASEKVTRDSYADAIDEDMEAHVEKFGSKLPLLGFDSAV